MLSQVAVVKPSSRRCTEKRADPSPATGGIIPVKVQVRARYTWLSQLKLFERENNVNPTHVTDWVDQGSYTLVSSSTADRITTAVYNWNWNSVGTVMMGMTGLHNGAHDLKAKATFAGKIIKEEITGKSTNNLVISSCSPDSVVCWKGEEGTTVPIAVNLTDNDLNDAVTLTLTLYATNVDNRTSWPAVRTITSSPTTSSQYTFNWDGKDANGNYVQPWTYTFEVTATQTDINNDDPTLTAPDAASYRSKYLSIVRATDANGQPIFDAEYEGYDDNGTPDDETDDNEEYYVRSYSLKDSGGLDAHEGTIYLYNDSETPLHSWDISTLDCLEHNDDNDGLEADINGIKHDLLVRVPVSVIEQGGPLKFVISTKDAHSTSYRDHKNRPAFELNQKIRPGALWIWIDGLNGNSLNTEVDWEQVRLVFARIGIPVIYGAIGAGYITAGTRHTISPPSSWGLWTWDWYGLSIDQVSAQIQAAQLVQPRRTVVLTTSVCGTYSSQLSTIASCVHWKGGTNKDLKYSRALPAEPAVININTHAVQNWGDEEWTIQQLKYAYTNIVIHELTHIATNGLEHCTSGTTCVFGTSINTNYYSGYLSNYWPNSGWYLPWLHSDEINQIKRALNYAGMRSNQL